MFSSVAKLFVLLASIAAGVGVAVFLATSAPLDLNFALRMPSEVTPQKSLAEPDLFPQLPGQPAPFLLPQDNLAAPSQPRSSWVRPTNYTQNADPAAQGSLPPPPPANQFDLPTPPAVTDASAVPPDLMPPNPEEPVKPADPFVDDADPTTNVESHPLPKRNFLSPRRTTTTTTTQIPPAQAPNPAVPAHPQPLETLPPAPQIHRGEGDNKLYINVQNTDIREVLQLIGAQGGLNILASKNVSGNVSATLNGVDVHTALSAILRSHGLAARSDGRIIFVGTPADLQSIDQSADRLTTRVYRPNYASATELQKLITPMLTLNVGRCTISTPAQVDIPADQVSTGGDSFGGNEVLIVRDYEAVLASVDQLIAEVDTRPSQVSIETMILSVKLSDQYKLGINFEVLRDRANIRLAQGQPAADLAALTFTPGSLKLGFLDGSLSGLVEALETVGDTNVIASPKLTVLNKQKAEIQIGEQLGYVNTTVTENASTQSVAFLDVGTLLRIRPFISSDNLIRLEVHPELSTGNVVVQSGLTLPNKSITQVTTNVMCRDGCTVILGGLIREDLKNDTKQLPVLGNLPWVGPLFRNKTESVERTELIVLLKPRIVGDAILGEEGARLEHEFSARQGTYFAKMSPLGKRHMGEKHYRQARASVAAGDYKNALEQVNLSIHYDPLNREAIMLREQIIEEGGFSDESIHQYLRQGLAPWSHHNKDYSKQGYPWKTPPEHGFDDGNQCDEPQDRGAVTPRTVIEPQRLPVQP